MRNRIYIFCLVLFMFGFVAQGRAQSGRSEIAIGYGYFSIFSLINGVPYNASSGTTALVYRYYLTKDVTLGLGIGTENIKNYGSFTTFAPELTVAYLDTRHSLVRVRLYGSIAYGISYFSDNNIGPDQIDNSGVKAVGFHASPIGIRVGRQIAAFAELGLGYKGLFHVGADFRWPRVLAKNRHRED